MFVKFVKVTREIIYFEYILIWSKTTNNFFVLPLILIPFNDVNFPLIERTRQITVVYLLRTSNNVAGRMQAEH